MRGELSSGGGTGTCNPVPDATPLRFLGDLGGESGVGEAFPDAVLLRMGTPVPNPPRGEAGKATVPPRGDTGVLIPVPFNNKNAQRRSE